MKVSPSEWSLEFIEEIGNSSEHSWVDFKKSPALDPNGANWNNKRREISKDISAFSIEGGYIIYGVDGRGKIDETGGVSTHLKGAKLTSEWISQSFSPLVTPNQKVDVFPVPNESGSKAIYVVEIPESLFAPHQALDNRYYGRLGDRSQPLSDALVRAVMFRQSQPVVRPIFSGFPESERMRIHVKFRNYGSVRANDFAFYVAFPEDYTNQNTPVFVENPKYVNLNFRTHANVPVAVVLHPEEELEMQHFFRNPTLLPNFFLSNERKLLFNLPIRWKLFVDDSRPVSGEFTIEQILNENQIEYHP